MLKNIFLFLLINLLTQFCFGQLVSNIAKPSIVQLNWHQLQYYWFLHFGPNTFTDVEWGNGKEKEATFNPINLNCNQWCATAKAAGATQLIITAKHHDGFCLWPSKYSKHTVQQSKWKNGNGDVLKELQIACIKYGLKFGVYISPWDRNHPDYGTQKYNEVFVNMLKELFTNYSPINELWWDGANGEEPNGKKQIYDWEKFKKIVKQLSPNTLIFSDVGPHIRWCGNEDGIAGMPNFNALNVTGYEPGNKAPNTTILNNGKQFGEKYIPAECDVSIRPGWFYHKSEDNKLKTAEQLFNLYLKSVGRGANLLLNVPPTPQGLIHPNDSIVLLHFNKYIMDNFKNDLLTNAKLFFKKLNYSLNIFLQKNKKITVQKNDYILIELATAQNINCIMLKENLLNGQLCNQFQIKFFNEKNEEIYNIKSSTIGYKRILTFPTIQIKKIEILNNSTTPQINIATIAAFKIDENLIEKK